LQVDEQAENAKAEREKMCELEKRHVLQLAEEAKKAVADQQEALRKDKVRQVREQAEVHHQALEADSRQVMLKIGGRLHEYHLALQQRVLQQRQQQLVKQQQAHEQEIHRHLHIQQQHHQQQQQQVQQHFARPASPLQHHHYANGGASGGLLPVASPRGAASPLGTLPYRSAVTLHEPTPTGLGVFQDPLSAMSPMSPMSPGGCGAAHGLMAAHAVAGYSSPCQQHHQFQTPGAFGFPQMS